MDTATKPIVTTTSLSLLLHSAAIAGALLVYDQVAMVDEGVGQGVEIQLISSVLVSDQQQTEMPKKQAVMSDVSTEQQQSLLPLPTEKASTEHVLTTLNSTQPVVSEDKIASTASDNVAQHTEAKQPQQQEQLNVYHDTSPAPAKQATAASQQQHTILELLHRRISENKEYPYLARRQRREGVATVAFVLHPDGSVEDARLVASSHAQVLDRAALAAVEQVAPLEAAKDYLETPETFQVDIEFDLL